MSGNGYKRTFFWQKKFELRFSHEQTWHWIDGPEKVIRVDHFVGSMWWTKSFSGAFTSTTSVVLFRSKCQLQMSLNFCDSLAVIWSSFSFSLCSVVLLERKLRALKWNDILSWAKANQIKYSQMASYSAKAHCWQTIREAKYWRRPLLYWFDWFVCRSAGFICRLFFFQSLFFALLLCYRSNTCLKCAAKCLATRRNGCALDLSTKYHCTCLRQSQALDQPPPSHVHFVAGEVCQKRAIRIPALLLIWATSSAKHLHWSMKLVTRPSNCLPEQAFRLLGQFGFDAYAWNEYGVWRGQWNDRVQWNKLIKIYSHFNQCR